MRSWPVLPYSMDATALDYTHFKFRHGCTLHTALLLHPVSLFACLTAARVTRRCLLYPWTGKGALPGLQVRPEASDKAPRTAPLPCTTHTNAFACTLSRELAFTRLSYPKSRMLHCYALRRGRADKLLTSCRPSTILSLNHLFLSR